MLLGGRQLLCLLANCKSIACTWYLFYGFSKECHKRFPKEVSEWCGWFLTAQRGDTITTRHAFVVNLKKREIYGHALNEPGTVGVPKKVMVSSWNHTVKVDYHVTKQWMLNEGTGESKVII